MKVSDYIAAFLEKHQVKVVFGYQGSSIAHVIDSIVQNGRVRYISMRHEQGAAFAANGYVLVSGEMGVAVACSGPGALNLISGIANAYFDSLPCLFLTGQVSQKEMRSDRLVRQNGFQETDIVSIVRPITKYAVSLREPESLAYELEKAVYMAHERRPGPVLVDVPYDLQKSSIETDMLRHFARPAVAGGELSPQELAKVMERLRSAQRPLVVLGGGSRCIRQNNDVAHFLCELGVPVVASYRGKDCISHRAPVFCGVIGAYGNRYANWAVQYCDFALVLGSRLDNRQTGAGREDFATKAEVSVVDLDPGELGQMPERFQRIQSDTMVFLRKLKEAGAAAPNGRCWLGILKGWQRRYPDTSEYGISEAVNPNLFFKELSAAAQESAIFSLDVGQNQLWGNASLQVGWGQALMQSCGLGAMGFSLPAAIGGYFSAGTQTICICGDGGFQMNLQELQTVALEGIPIKIFVLNNRSLGLIRDFQSKLLGGRFSGSVDGFGSPDYKLLAEAYHLDYAQIPDHDALEKLPSILSGTNGCLVEVCISSGSQTYPEPAHGLGLGDQARRISAEERMLLEKEAYDGNR